MLKSSLGVVKIGINNYIFDYSDFKMPFSHKRLVTKDIGAK